MARVALGYGVAQVSALWMGVYVVVGRLLVGRVRRMGKKKEKNERRASSSTSSEKNHNAEKKEAGRLNTENIPTIAATSSDLLPETSVAGIVEVESGSCTQRTYESDKSDAPDSPSTVFFHPDSTWETSSQEG